MTIKDATLIVNGRKPDCSEQDELAAWQFLLRTGVVWGMGKWYSEMATSLIENGEIYR